MQTLDRAIAGLGSERVMAMVISDGVADDDWPDNPIGDIPRKDWQLYEVEEISRTGSHSVVYRSPTAETMHPGQRNVRIRVEFLVTFSPLR